MEAERAERERWITRERKKIMDSVHGYVIPKLFVFYLFSIFKLKVYTVLSGVVYAVHVFFCLFLTYAQKCM